MTSKTFTVMLAGIQTIKAIRHDKKENRAMKAHKARIERIVI